MRLTLPALVLSALSLWGCKQTPKDYALVESEAAAFAEQFKEGFGRYPVLKPNNWDQVEIFNPDGKTRLYTYRAGVNANDDVIERVDPQGNVFTIKQTQ